MTARHHGNERSVVRPEIQALRALAVILVVLYHLWPKRLTGGYIGVDVFFVISGFLITSHLLREVVRTGTITLAAFWARRVRRLLPAAMLVLVVVAIATILLVPDVNWRQYMTEIGASSIYLQNWQLAGDSVSYLAQNNSGSPVQHFWSLSLEEQFYLVWPVLLLIGLLATRSRSAQARHRVLLGIVIGLTIVSFVVSIVWTQQTAASAYFVTPTRMWEFGAGGLLAFLPALAGGARVRSALSWLGLAAMVVSAIVLNGATAFPGYIAVVPVLGAVAVILAGNPGTAWSPLRIGGLRPVQFVGDISYSLYLWHWPFIVIIPFIVGGPLTAVGKIGVIAGSVLIAYLTKKFVEDRFRTAPTRVIRRNRSAFLSAATAMLVLVATCGVTLGVLDGRDAAEAQRLEVVDSSKCFGAAAMEPANKCADPFATTGVMTPTFAKTDLNEIPDSRGGTTCEAIAESTDIRTCEIGSSTQPTRTIAMLGDSHVMHYMEAMRAITEHQDWKVLTFVKSSCGATGASDVVLNDLAADQSACAEWGTAVVDEIIANPAIDTVMFSNSANRYSQDDGANPITVARYQAVWNKLIAAGKKVLVIADVPRTQGVNIPDCLVENSADPTLCDTTSDVALTPDVMAQAAATYTSGTSLTLLDMTDKYCVDATCHVRIGGVIVYADLSHITNTWARTLAPYIEAALVSP
ncbi:acyltransferase family protein [Glaciihabitans sp. dw_435]|uniref:acyltransferase family protein n=1 Tax=Glaciihabitans sp. dw_435 TaxID=2720081 RepID=UPI001BD3DB6A|nr:acyltransferase family protein [Glaciihabitans sp. dw_435]